MEESHNHFSVLKQEIIEYLVQTNSCETSLYLDLTFGRGGHATSILDLMPKAHLIGVDQDADAINFGEPLVKKYGGRLKLFHENFGNFPLVAKENNLGQFSGILLDLGVSSPQLDNAHRGFSFREDGPLDMRMNQSDRNGYTAEDIVNEMEEEDLANIIFKYGEERYSRRIAKNICAQRKIKRIQTTKELEKIIFETYPIKDRFKGLHPATRTFQAIRIVVNDELKVVETVIEPLWDLLADKGRLAIISFHSLEDRIVKHKFKEIVEKNPENAKILTKKPIVPTDEELLMNPRSRSSKLRIIEKNQEGFFHDKNKKKQK